MSDYTEKIISEKKVDKDKRYLGSIAGFLVTIGIGFAFYLIIPVIPTLNLGKYAYSNIINDIDSSLLKQVMWFFINFTEADFSAGVFSSIFGMVGAFIAWQLAKRGSKYSGIAICYGESSMWPWVFVAQSLSLILTLCIFPIFDLLASDNIDWLPTFIVVVTSPAAIMLTYGPSWRNLVTAAVLPALFGTPATLWYRNIVVPLLEIPLGVSNLLGMALTGFMLCSVCTVLPWMEKKETVKYPKPVIENTHSPLWSIRKSLADFSDPHFWGNEIASIGIIFGATLDWIINPKHTVPVT